MKRNETELVFLSSSIVKLEKSGEVQVVFPARSFNVQDTSTKTYVNLDLCFRSFIGKSEDDGRQDLKMGEAALTVCMSPDELRQIYECIGAFLGLTDTVSQYQSLKGEDYGQDED